jgi:hypothetical protein
MYLSLALLLGTAQLFGAESVKLPDINDSDIQGVSNLLEQVVPGASVSDAAITARWMHDKDIIEKLTTAGRLFKAWTLDEALQYDPRSGGASSSLLGKAIIDGAKTSLADLATDLYIVKNVYGKELSNAIIEAFLIKEAKEKGNVDTNKLKLLLSQRDKTQQDDLKTIIKNLSYRNPGADEAVTRVYTPGQLQAFVDAGLFTSHEIQNLLNKSKASKAENEAFIASLGGATIAAPSEPATSEPSTSAPQKTEAEVVSDLTAMINTKKPNEKIVQAIAIALSDGTLSSINALNKTGQSLLHIAAYMGNHELAQWLLDNGADRDNQNKQKQTPLQVAEKHNKAEVIALLKPQTLQPGESSSGNLAQAQREKEEREAAEAIARKAEEAEAKAKAEQEEADRIAAAREAERLHAEDEAKARAQAAEEEADRREAERLQAEERKRQEEAAKVAAPTTPAEPSQPSAPKAEQKPWYKRIFSASSAADETAAEKALRKENLIKKLSTNRGDILFVAIDENNLPRVQNALKTLKNEPELVEYGLIYAASNPNTNLAIAKELTNAVLASSADPSPLLTQVAKSSENPDVRRYLTEQALEKKGLKGYEETVEGIIKRRAGQKLTQQNLRDVWKELTAGGQLTAGEAEQLVKFANDPTHTTDQAANRLWVLANNLIAANPTAIDHLQTEDQSVSGLNQETIKQWHEIVARKQRR